MKGAYSIRKGIFGRLFTTAKRNPIEDDEYASPWYLFVSLAEVKNLPNRGNYPRKYEECYQHWPASF